MSSFFQPSAELLQAFGFVRYSAPPGQARYSRPSACGQETIVVYNDDELTLLEAVNGQLLYSFQGRLASEEEFRVLLRQVNWAAEPEAAPQPETVTKPLAESASEQVHSN